jgi:ATP-dependent Clp protease ATP-binding subunit ClpA
MRVVREHFRPEFLNRVDDMVIFRPLRMVQDPLAIKILNAHSANRSIP